MTEAVGVTRPAAAVPARLREEAAAELRGAAASLTFLTRLPLGRAVEIDGADLVRSAPYFPLVGAGVGAISALVGLALARVVPPLLSAVVALVAYAGLTGALHLDAVADTFDALGTRSREEALRVMREPTIGAYGATALFLDLFLWTALLTTLVSRPSFLPLLVVVGALSRAGPVLLLAALPYVRPQGGAGRSLADTSRLRAGAAVAIAVGLAALLLGLPGVLLAVVAVSALVPLAVGFRRWLGGVTGDSLGCSVEVLQIVGLSAGLGLLAVGALR